MPPVPHTCNPGSYCPLCARNVRNGGAELHPGNATQRTPTPLPPPPDRPQWKPVPTPKITPARERLVITLAVGTEGHKTHQLTRRSQRDYADRIGADYRAITDATQDWFMLEKFRYRDWVKAYPGGTICIDADIWVSAEAPDLFTEVPADKIGVSISDDLHEHGLMPKFNRELAEVCQSQGVDVPPGATETHWNSGLVVVRPGHADYWTPPTLPIPRHWIAEELWSKATTFRRGWELHNLPHPSIHWQFWRDQPMRHLADKPAFIHPAGMTQFPNGLARRLELFQQLEAGKTSISLTQPRKKCGACGQKRPMPRKPI